MKNRWAKKKGYKIYYLTFDESFPNIYGYPYYIYTKLENLLKDVKMDLGLV